MNQSKRQVARFLLVGCSTAVLDLIIYKIIIECQSASIAKTISFCSGALYAYHFNKNWTFQSNSLDRHQFAKFSLVYTTNLGVNVWTNALMLSLLPKILEWRIDAAFLVATAASATFNFLGMKCLVFSGEEKPVSR